MKEKIKRFRAQYEKDKHFAFRFSPYTHKALLEIAEEQQKIIDDKDLIIANLKAVNFKEENSDIGNMNDPWVEDG